MKVELRPSDYLAYEKDTFWLLLEGVGNPSDIRAALAKLEDSVHSKLAARWPLLDFNPCVGVAFAQPVMAPYELPQAAQLALEQALLGQVRWYEPSLVQSTLEETGYTKPYGRPYIRSSWGEPPWASAYTTSPSVPLAAQPSITSRPCWQHPEQGMISPTRFLPILEEEGWIVELGNWIIGEAIARASAWGVPVAVNLASGQLEPSLPRRVIAYMAQCNLPPQELILEVTEQVTLNEISLSVLQNLALQGHPLHLDDFGTGFSSLERAATLPLSAIKLGQGFIKPWAPTPLPIPPRPV